MSQVLTWCPVAEGTQHGHYHHQRCGSGPRGSTNPQGLPGRGADTRLHPQQRVARKAPHGPRSQHGLILGWVQGNPCPSLTHNAETHSLEPVLALGTF